jgi:REP element-mobilizing transposase RayT
LYFYSLEQRNEVVRIPARLRAAVGEAFRKRLEGEGHRVLAVAVSAMHVHILVELPDERAGCRLILGRCKQAACFGVKHELQGGIWAAGGEFRLIRDRAHQVNAYRYILEEQGEEAWVWSFCDERRGGD